MSDNCPTCTIYKEVNLANHMQAIKFANLGPADPRQPSTLFWGDKMDKWKVPEGVARSRLCMNCEEYNDTPENQVCITTGPGAQLKASELPVTPKWADINGMPAAICDRWVIPCSAIRTCDDWEPISNEMD
jgi:hypothetical protein